MTPSTLTTGAWPAVTSVPSEMAAAVLTRFGGPEVLQMHSAPTPVPKPGEALVRVASVSVGRLLDVVARSGKHPYASFTFPHILGAEHAGVVAALGPGVTELQIGNKVAGFPVVVQGEDEFTRAGYSELSPRLQLLGTHRPGAYAQYVCIPAENLTVVPDTMNPAEVAALALAGPVAMNQFTRAGGVGQGTRVIVQGATSALGLTTALLAKHLGAQVIVTSRHESKQAQLRGFGFDHVLDAVEPSFVDEVGEVFEGKGAQLISDNLGAPMVWEHGLQVLAPGGAIVSSGAFLGHNVPVNLQRLYSKGQRIVGVKTGNLAAVGQLWQEVAKGFRTITDKTFTLEQAPAAHHYVEAGRNVGRVSLEVE
ncbi:zinc-binding dehydrogenase [Arthrobacter sp. CDRTa11]|uniref:quinone oxidoreductase family protein n=1 Tax=Arthrobacter sp. CDRTa11 TaxID=2651199 RepID=UPI002265A63E|nr:zinc-binding dehydrogenase [Arthrobacter sp. CDRTa11]UZX03041.1 zinc-binding dehydrogenase [Arthrobacter sp. CDRTa11]